MAVLLLDESRITLDTELQESCGSGNHYSSYTSLDLEDPWYIDWTDSWDNSPATPPSLATTTTLRGFSSFPTIANSPLDSPEINRSAGVLGSDNFCISWPCDPQRQGSEPESGEKVKLFSSSPRALDLIPPSVQNSEPKDLCSRTKRNNKPSRAFTELVFRTEVKSTGNLRRGCSVPRRRGPLKSKSREVAREIRSIGACWRCKIMKTSCDGANPCTACPRDWSNSNWKEVQCRRTQLVDLADGFIPRDMVPPPARTSPLRPEQTQTKVSTNNDLNDDFRDIKVFREAYSIPHGGGTCAIFDLLRSAMRYQETTSETDLIRQSIQCLRVCLRIRLTQKHIRQSSSLPICTDNTLKIKEYEALRDSMRSYLRKLQCTIFVRGGIRHHKHWLSIFYSLCIQSSVRIVLSCTLKRKDDPREQLRKDLEVRECEILPFYRLLVKIFSLSSGSFDPLVEDCSLTSNDSEGWRGEYYQEAQKILKTDQWPMWNISDSSGYLERLFDEKSRHYGFL